MGESATGTYRFDPQTGQVVKVSASTSRGGIPDVYFKEPYFDPHLAHPENSQTGTFIRSKAHKAQVMKELGISEKGDRRHGAR